MIPPAHAGGGDELLLALVPILVFMAVYRLVRGPGEDVPSEPGPAARAETRGRMAP